MFEQKELDDYLPGEYCVFVRSTHFGDGTKDLSLFSLKEWQYLLELSIVYSEILERSKCLPEGEGRTEMINIYSPFPCTGARECDNSHKRYDTGFLPCRIDVRQAQLFFDCEYCRAQSPKEMVWSLVVFNRTQHSMLVEEFVRGKNRTYNCFRDWVRENVDITSIDNLSA